MEFLLNNSIDCEKEYSRLLNLSQEEQDKLENYQADLETSRDRFGIAFSTEPSTDDIHMLEPNVSKGTGLEVVLMEIRAKTTNYVREERDSN